MKLTITVLHLDNNNRLHETNNNNRLHETNNNCTSFRQ